jgi:hypothetical protein
MDIYSLRSPHTDHKENTALLLMCECMLRPLHSNSRCLQSHHSAMGLRATISAWKSNMDSIFHKDQAYLKFKLYTKALYDTLTQLLRQKIWQFPTSNPRVSIPEIRNKFYIHFKTISAKRNVNKRYLWIELKENFTKEHF